MILVHSAIDFDAHAPKGFMYVPWAKWAEIFATSSIFSWHTVLYVELALDKC